MKVGCIKPILAVVWMTVPDIRLEIRLLVLDTD
jgi:hypothetical protein